MSENYPLITEDNPLSETINLWYLFLNFRLTKTNMRYKIMKIMSVNKDAILTTKILSLITNNVPFSSPPLQINIFHPCLTQYAAESDKRSSPSDLIYCNLLQFFSFHFTFSGEPCRNPASPWVVTFKHATILIYLLPSYTSTGKYEQISTCFGNFFSFPENL